MKKEELLKRTKKELLALAGEEGARLSARLRKSELVDQVMSLLSVRKSRKRPSKSNTLTLEANPSSSRRSKGAPTRPAANRSRTAKGPAPRELLEVSQRISRLFPVPLTKTEIVFFEIDPFHAYAFWHVRLDDMEAGRKALGPAGAHAPLLLRVYDVTLIDFDGSNAHLTFDNAAHSLQSHWYFDFWESGRSYIVDIGLQPHDAPFYTLARSNPIHLPPNAPSGNFDRSGIVVDPEIRIVCEVADITCAETLSDLRPEPRPDMEATTSDDLVRSFYRRLTEENSQGLARPKRESEESSEEGAPFQPSGETGSGTRHPQRDPYGVGEETAALGTYARIRAESQVALIDGEDSGPLRGAARSRAGESRASPEQGRSVQASRHSDSSYSVAEASAHQHLSSWIQGSRQGLPESGSDLPGSSGVSSWVTSPGAAGQNPETLDQVIVVPSPDLKSGGSISEIFAELVIGGRAAPGSQFSLLGQPVRLRPDGTFSLRKRLPGGAMIVPLPDAGIERGTSDPEGGSS